MATALGVEQLKNLEDGSLHTQIPICSYDKNCTRDVSVHCCGIMMCETCSVDHYFEHHEHQGKTNLLFDKVDNKLTVLCDEHVSECTHLCAGDNKFLCAYCLKPGNIHETHTKNTIEVEVRLIREALINDASEKENIHRFMKITEENILLTNKKLEDLLQTRKEECLSAYNDFVEREGEMLKCKFRSICDEHMKQYPQIDSEYNQNKLSKSNVELVLQKKVILDTLCKNENILSLNCETVSLSDTFDFQDKHPLGDIQVTNSEEVLVTNQAVPTLKEESEKERINILSKLVDDYKSKLNVLTEEYSTLKAQMNSKSKSKSHHKKKSKRLPEEKTMLKAQIDDKSKSDYEEKSKRLPEEKTMLKNQTDDKSKNASKIIKKPMNINIQAFFDISIDNRPVGRMIISMFHLKVPKTCTKFIQLCTHEKGFGYKGSKFHEITMMPTMMYCGGGDITDYVTEDGNSLERDDEVFMCENFMQKYHGQGIVSMNGTDNAAFRIFTTQLTDAGEDNRHGIIFGQVTNGTYYVVEKIITVGRRYGKPLQDIVIENCGVCN